MKLTRGLLSGIAAVVFFALLATVPVAVFLWIPFVIGVMLLYDDTHPDE